MSDDQTENKTQHLHILMAPSEVTSIDDWGFRNRIRTRGEAIRRLCQMGLALDTRSEALLKASLSGAEVYRKSLESLAAALKDDALSIEQQARASALLLPDLLTAMQELVLNGIEVSELTRPYRTGEELGDANMLVEEFRKLMEEVRRQP